jgi:Uma2 family endonuclease
MSKERIVSLPEEQRHRFFHIAPEFVIELKSATDRLKILREKMEEWVANGTELG